MKKLLAVVLLVLLGACTTITKVEGDQVVNNRLAVKVSNAWNKVSLPGGKQPFEVWTQEGIFLDQLRFWAALPSGEGLVMNPPRRAGDTTPPRIPIFNAAMPPDRLVNLFETMYSTDGSLVQVTKIEPAVFAGQTGLRFEFTIARKSDDLQLQGTGWVAVHNKQMFAATFVAPKLSFYPRLLPRAEEIVRTAQIRG